MARRAVQGNHELEKLSDLCKVLTILVKGTELNWNEQIVQGAIDDVISHASDLSINQREKRKKEQ